jgi:hypothetical protein
MYEIGFTFVRWVGDNEGTIEYSDVSGGLKVHV